MTPAYEKELIDKNYETMPLNTKESFNKFIDAIKIYSKYKGQSIICLGRSPKWFLNASL